MNATAVQKQQSDQSTYDVDSLPVLQDTLSSEEIIDIGRETVSNDDLKQKTTEVFKNFDQYQDSFSDETTASIRKGTLAWLLGEPEDALVLLKDVEETEESLFVKGLSCKDIQEEHRATQHFDALFEQLKDGESFPYKVFLHYMETLLKRNQIEDANELLNDVKDQTEEHPDVRYLKGLLAELNGKREEAYECYEEALELDDEHIRSLFRKANLLQVYADSIEGEDQSPEEVAQEIYERLMKLSPAHEGVIINLGVLYEDTGNFHRAQDCYNLVLEDQPDHSIAEMYVKDAKASLNLSYNEERLRQQMQKSRLLNKSVDEFEFSQRIQTAFDQLGIKTIGDLLQRTEQELLSCDNFGTLSLERLRKFLENKGLSLARKGRKKVTLKPTPPPEDTDDILKKPVEQFDWSARSQRAMKRLSVFTVNDLIEKTEEELLDCQNFGETSLQEVKNTLDELGLSLKDSNGE